MMIQSTKIKNWEIIGLVFTIIFGSLLHFVFEWSGRSNIVALFGAVNESTWEHLKLAFWPTFVFSLIEWLVWGREIKNFCLAALIKLAIMPIIIVALFYLWLIFFPDNFIWDISIFILAVTVGYFLGYKIMTSKKEYRLERISTILIIVMLLKFSLLTYFPIISFITKDPVSGGYGIIK